MPTSVPLGDVECAMGAPLGDVEWHAHETMHPRGHWGKAAPDDGTAAEGIWPAREK